MDNKEKENSIKTSWWAKLFKKDKTTETANNTTITIYAIYHSPANKLDMDNPSSLPAPIYYAATREEAVEVVHRSLYVRRFPHFKLWLECHEELLRQHSINPNDPNNLKFCSQAWALYLQITFVAYQDSPMAADDDKYSIVTMHYSSSDVAVFLRTLTAVQPLGMPTETPEEIANYLLFKNMDTNLTDIPDALDALAVSDGNFYEKIVSALKMTFPTTNTSDAILTKLKDSINDMTTPSDTDTSNNNNGTAGDVS